MTEEKTLAGIDRANTPYWLNNFFHQGWICSLCSAFGPAESPEAAFEHFMEHRLSRCPEYLSKAAYFEEASNYFGE